jgi:hypothetical protein
MQTARRDAAPPKASPRQRIDAAELHAHIHRPYEYPPTECLLSTLTGRDFEKLKERGGHYNDENGPDERGGYKYDGATCPQPGCGLATIWVHPDGRAVVVMRDGNVDPARAVRDLVTIYSNDAELERHPPAAVNAAIEEARQLDPEQRSPPLQFRWRIRQPAFAGSCAGEALRERTRRYLAHEAGTACDAEFFTPSSSADAVVAPHPGEKSHFHSHPSPGARRAAYLVKGDLVALGHIDPKQRAFTCVAYSALDGKRSVGWLSTRDLVSLPGDRDPQAKDAKKLVQHLDASPAWWSRAKSKQRFGPLALLRTADGADVNLRLDMAGHTCGVEGPMTAEAPRMLVATSAVGCPAIALLFNNGVFMWAGSDCAGMRASCTGGFVRR